MDQKSPRTFEGATRNLTQEDLSMFPTITELKNSSKGFNGREWGMYIKDKSISFGMKHGEDWKLIVCIEDLLTIAESCCGDYNPNHTIIFYCVDYYGDKTEFYVAELPSGDEPLRTEIIIGTQRRFNTH